MDHKIKILNSFAIFIILIYFVTYISCDECTIKAVCLCVPKNHSNTPINFNEKLNNHFEPADTLNLCEFSGKADISLSVNNYVLSCTYIDQSNSSSFKPPNGTLTPDKFVLNLLYPCAEPTPKPPVPESKYSTGSILVIIFFTCVLSYLTLGICVNYILIGARGIEMLPHLDFWRDFPALVLDGVKFLQNGCTARPSDLSAPAGAEGYDAI